MLLSSLDAVRWAARYASDLPALRAVIAEHLPAGIVPQFAALGIAALTADAATLKKLGQEKSLTLPAPNGSDVSVSAGATKAELKWVAIGAERSWTESGTARGSAAPPKPGR